MYQELSIKRTSRCTTKGMNCYMNTMEIRKAGKLLETFRLLDANISAQSVVVFLYVAEQEGISMHALAEKVGLLQSTCSRTVASLTRTHRINKPGLDLLFTEEAPSDRRYKTVRLTPKGKRLWTQIQEI